MECVFLSLEVEEGGGGGWAGGAWWVLITCPFLSLCASDLTRIMTCIHKLSG